MNTLRLSHQTVARWFAIFTLIAAPACGGKAVIDGGQGGAASSSSTSTTTSTTSTATVTASTGVANCTTHQQCPSDTLCHFATGQCVPNCGPNSECFSCPTGEVCDQCGTSSCPGCEDCRAVCLPVGIAAGECDDHTDCGPQGVCIFSTRTCRPTCDADVCTDAQFCDVCATSSVPCVNDCFEACSG